MKRTYVLGFAGTAGVVVALAVTAPMVLVVSAAVGVVGVLLYWVGRCRHGDRLGLLPPTTNADGTRTPARWYCDNCGRSWSAGLEHDRSPVVRFTGYDQTRLPAAARRAAALEKQKQALAVRRAGLVAPRPTAPAVAKVTPISQRRAAR